MPLFFFCFCFTATTSDMKRNYFAAWVTGLQVMLYILLIPTIFTYNLYFDPYTMLIKNAA